MTFNLFVYRHEKSGEYAQPFMSAYDGDSLIAGLKKDGCPAHMAQLSLYKIGEIDNLTGQLKCMGRAEFVTDFKQFVREEESKDAEASDS